MPNSFRYSLPVAAPATRVWALVRDVRRVAGLFSYVTIDEFTTLAPDCWQFRRQLAIPTLTTLSWYERSEVTREGELSFRAVDGDLDTFDGAWTVAHDGDGASLTLVLTYAIPDGVGPKVPAALAKYAMEEIFKTICQRVKEEAEHDTPELSSGS